MTRQRNLGPALALVGGGVALVAAIAGFLIVGGPGDTRDKRIDHWRLSQVAQAIDILDCAYSVIPEAPSSLATALETLSQHPRAATRNDCRYIEDGAVRSVNAVEYRKLGASSIELCQTFLRPEPTPPNVGDPDYADVIYPDGPFGRKELRIPRPNAGRFCYTINLSMAPPMSDAMPAPPAR